MQQRCKQRRYVGGLPNALDTLGWAQLLGGELEWAKSPFVESITLVKEIGDKLALWSNLAGLACVVGAEGQALVAARLLGAAKTIMEAIGYRPEPQQGAMIELHRASSPDGAAHGRGALPRRKVLKVLLSIVAVVVIAAMVALLWLVTPFERSGVGAQDATPSEAGPASSTTTRAT
jgi:hypothetical protein